GSRSPHVGQLLLANNIDIKIGVLGIFANDHAFVDFDARPHEEYAALLEIVESVRSRKPGPVRNQRSRRAMRDFTLPLDVSGKKRIHHDGAARVGEERAAQSDQAAAGHAEFHAHSTVAVIVHVGDFALARADMLHDHADEFFGDIDGEVLDWLHQFASFFVVLGDDLGLADHQFVTFAAHHLDENRKLQFAAAENLERIGAASLFHAQGDVGEQLFIEALAQVARRDVGAFASAERRRVDGEEHRNRGLVDNDGRKRRGVLCVGDSLADGDAFDAGYGDNVAERSFGNVGTLEAGKTEELGDFCFVK